MKRLGIFVFYDADGIVDKYIEELLKSLMTELQELVIVINGFVQRDSKNVLKKYANRIFERENIGFDGGAYKEAFNIFLQEEKWEKWEEIVLFNDTFYSGFCEWKNIFAAFETEQVDFWGLTHRDNGEFLDGGIINRHLQGYFIAIRKTLFLNECFFEFWRQLCYPKTYREAITGFEISFTTYFEQLGFSWKSWLELKDIAQEFDCTKNTYINDCDKLIIKYQFPVLKRRAISIVTWKQSFSALKYIKNNLEYDINNIQKHIDRLSEQKRIKPFGFKELDLFCRTHKKIYIYGKGIIGNAVREYLLYRGFEIAGFLVTDISNQNDDLQTVQFDEYTSKENDGIIIALNQKNFEEVYFIVSQRCSEKQILIPRYDK